MDVSKIKQNCNVKNITYLHFQVSIKELTSSIGIFIYFRRYQREIIIICRYMLIYFNSQKRFYLFWDKDMVILLSVFLFIIYSIVSIYLFLYTDDQKNRTILKFNKKASGHRKILQSEIGMPLRNCVFLTLTGKFY